MTFYKQRKIDTRNGGQTCMECRMWRQDYVRHDRFWGEIPVTSYCTKFMRTVIPSDGQDCNAFLKKIFNGDR